MSLLNCHLDHECATHTIASAASGPHNALHSVARRGPDEVLENWGFGVLTLQR